MTLPSTLLENAVDQLATLPGIGRRTATRLALDLLRREPEAVRRFAMAIIAFTSAIAAYGAFFIPKAYGTSIALTGGPVAALWGFLVFYVICVAITWVVYTRPGGLLHDIEHGRTPQGTAAQPAE